MPETSIQPTASSGGALSAEHYQTFEMAKANDGVIGGSNIAELRSYSAAARAQAQVIHKTIASLSSFEEVAAARAEAIETEQTYARVSIYADQRIGELLRELPKAANQHDSQQVVGAPTSTRQAEREAGISHAVSIDLQKMASNPEVVQAVLDKAESDGRIPSRKQVLDAIRERDEAREEAEQLGEDISELQAEVASLEAQTDQAYENGYKAATRQQGQTPQVVERRVEVVPEETERRLRELEHERDVYLADVQKLRRRNEDMRGELERAKGILGMDQSMQDVHRDVRYLINATNQYVRQYGGLTWTAVSLEQVDEPTREELKKAATNLATFASALVASLEEFNE